MNGTSLHYLVLGFGVMIVAMSAWGVMAPQRLVEVVTRVWSRPWSLWLAVGIRLLLGWVLLQVAPASRCPMALTVLGWVVIAAAVLLPLVGRERIGRVLAWGATQPQLMRAWCAVGVVLGLLLLWAVA